MCVAQMTSESNPDFGAYLIRQQVGEFWMLPV
jgi:hypothetical protein